MNLIYFDNNATTSVDPQVVEAMIPFLKDQYGNPSSIHRFGGQVRKYIEQAREAVAQLLGAFADEIIFTSCGTESDNSAFFSAINSAPENKRLITTQVEHPAVLNPAQYYEKKGYDVQYIGVDRQGHLNLDDLKKALNERAALVSVMWANNESGMIFPVETIAQWCRERGILFHSDAVQVAGKMKINAHEGGMDYLSISGHKLHAPKGVGALYARRGAPMAPFIIGGHQEHGLRGGTEAVPHIVALGKAAELALSHLEAEQILVKKLRDHLESRILNEIPKSYLNGDPLQRLANTTNISFEGVEGEAILLLLDEKGICASSGSACTTGSLEPSHVLRAMQVPYTIIHGSLRLSLSYLNTIDEVNEVVEQLKEIIHHLRTLSPYWQE